MKHKAGVWYPATEAPTDEDGDTFVLCVSGKEGNVGYDYAIIADDDNCYENGKWYIKGIAHRQMAVHGWYKVPDFNL